MDSGMPQYAPATIPKKDPLDGLDLHAEYDLIKQKKSSLSRSQRERVVRIVEAGPHKIADTNWANGE